MLVTHTPSAPRRPAAPTLPPPSAYARLWAAIAIGTSAVTDDQATDWYDGVRAILARRLHDTYVTEVQTDAVADAATVHALTPRAA